MRDPLLQANLSTRSILLRILFILRSILLSSYIATPLAMSFLPPPTDVPVLVSVAGTSSAMPAERRVTPSWTVQQLKAKLETMTGISPSNQKLKLIAPGREAEWLDDDNRQVGDWRLSRGCEIEVRACSGTSQS